MPEPQGGRTSARALAVRARAPRLASKRALSHMIDGRTVLRFVGGQPTSVRPSIKIRGSCPHLPRSRSAARSAARARRARAAVGDGGRRAYGPASRRRGSGARHVQDSRSSARRTGAAAARRLAEVPGRRSPGTSCQDRAVHERRAELDRGRARPCRARPVPSATGAECATIVHAAMRGFRAASDARGSNEGPHPPVPRRKKRCGLALKSFAIAR